MIESVYWKQDLLAHAKQLKQKKPIRYSEKRQVNFEKELIISFFKIRKLAEDNKLSDSTINHKVVISKFNPTGKKITKLNHHAFDELYDMDNEIKTTKGIIFLTNQFIHSVTLFAFQNSDHIWESIFLCSDFDRDKNLYLVTVPEVIKVFEMVCRNYPRQVSYTWDDKLGDYRSRTE